MNVATQISGGASALPFDAALAILPSLPRPVLSRLVTRMIERLDQIDGDDEREEDDEDHGAEENGEVEEGGMNPAYGIDQSLGALLPKT
jgi:hypothetical protein